MKKLFQGAVFAAAMLTASSAFAASALVTADLNLRTGPGTGYATIMAMPRGALVDVRGCTRGYNWCRVNWNGYDGWASANYLAHRSGGPAYSSSGAEIGIPLIAGAIIGAAILGSDHDDDHWRHYRRHRHWRHDHWRGRHHWRHGRHHHWRHHGRRWRHH